MVAVIKELVIIPFSLKRPSGGFGIGHYLVNGLAYVSGFDC